MSENRVLLVEDNTEAVPVLQRTIQRALPGASITCCNHNRAVEDPGILAAKWDIVLLDALAPLRDQYRDPSLPRRSLLASVDVAKQFDRLGDRCPTVIAYSATMHEPRINIPLWELRATIVSRHQFAEIQDDLRGIIEGRRPGVPAPDADDYGDLGIGPDARVVEALELAESREDVWNWIAEDGPHGDTQRSWVLSRIQPVLGSGCPRSTRHIIGLLRSVTGLDPRR
ncbi:MAG: hypothetical protein KDB02_01125 [Acidimicrobiales bacterium]|nr:hypothetical protein [Acidimicrobiales bacterium]